MNIIKILVLALVKANLRIYKSIISILAEEDKPLDKIEIVQRVPALTQRGNGKCDLEVEVIQIYYFAFALILDCEAGNGRAVARVKHISTLGAIRQDNHYGY